KRAISITFLLGLFSVAAIEAQAPNAPFPASPSTRPALPEFPHIDEVEVWRRPFADGKPELALENALIAAAHHFAQSNDLENLAGILQNYPKLVDRKQRF